MRATTDAERRAVVATIFAGYLLTGLVLVRSYGGSWDEPFTRDMGERTYRYIAGRLTGDRTPAAVVFAGMNAETGPTFEVVLYSLERLFRLDDGRQILLVRHGATFVMFWLGAVAFYTLLRFRFGRRLWALVGVAFLVLTPRLFAHAFYNSKDTVLVAWFAIAMLTLLRYRRERTFGSACLHAVTCAIATDVRLVGLLLPALTGVLLLVDLAAEGFRAAAIRKVVPTAIAYGVLLAFLVVLFWPQLWENPLHGLADRVGHLRAAAQGDNNMSLYLGEFVQVDQLPWHYLPWWMLITIPVPLTVAFVLGLGAMLAGFVTQPLLARENRDNLQFLLLFAVPVAAVIYLRPIEYDDWRHMYFVYPAFITIAMTGIVGLATRPRLATPVLATAVLMVVHLAVVDVGFHPYQNVYFNVLAGKNVDERYELDYWGLSFREGFEYVLATDERAVIPVSVSDYPGEVNVWLLRPEERARIELVGTSEASYFLSNHRQPGHFECFRTGKPPCANEIHAVRVDGARLLSVYKLR